ncbi:hypothetical protein [Stenotrophomonas maltophilia]|uniref:hypothetical protein n=1 Tax=Stenotrophomonas maltophilia TaxID=40324 RepID=UPI001FA7260F|nr:hypothetical protein [Stenotrophomonas maltophilia]
MSNDKTTLADVQPGGRVRLGDQAERARFDDFLSSNPLMALCAGTAWQVWQAALSAQPSPGGQDALAEAILRMADHYEKQADIAGRTVNEVAWLGQITHELRMLAARPPVGDQHPDDLAVDAFAAAMKAKMAEARAKGRGGWEDPAQCTAEDLSRMLRDHVEKGDPRDVANFCMMLHQRGEAIAARQPVGRSFQAGVAEWMGQCFLPSLYSDMTERGDRLLEEVLELLQAHGYDKARVPTLVDYVFGRPVGEPAQEVGGVMVTLAGYCWVAGIDMHAAGNAELARINQPDVMARIRAKQEAKNALHFDTPLPGNPAATDAWPREGDLVRYGDGVSALAIRLEPYAGGWHGYQCCGGYTFFTKAYRPSRADMDTWLDCAKYRDGRTKVADNRVAHEMYLLDSQEVANG